MLNRSIFSLCMCLTLMFVTYHSCQASTIKNETSEQISVNQENQFATTKYLTMTEEATLLWTVKNTSETEPLHYSVQPAPTGFCGTVIPVEEGTIEPGKSLFTSRGYSELPGTTREFKISLSGKSGTASLEVINFIPYDEVMR